MTVPAQNRSQLAEYARLEHRPLVLQASNLPSSWRNLTWLEQAACRFAWEPDYGMCEMCPVVDECLAAALLLDDPARLRAGLSRQERQVLWAAIEASAVRVDPGLARPRHDHHRA